ncbi:unnamed protein product, partial [marine sediment metagenome]
IFYSDQDKEVFLKKLKRNANKIFDDLSDLLSHG